MIKEYKIISKALTHICRIKGNVNKTILVIPGNPGIDTYYEHYMEKLANKMPVQEVANIICISYAGHINPSKCELRLSEDSNKLSEHVEEKKFYSLQDQIEHKISFIKEYIPRNHSIYLIGHSIGSYICLEAVNSLHKQYNIAAVLMLYPAIERMRISPQGKKAVPILSLLNWTLPSLMRLFRLLPSSMLSSIIRWNVGPKAPQCIVEATMQFFNPRSVSNCIYLLETEFECLSDDLLASQNAVVRSALKRCPVKAYYTEGDHWAPCHWGRQFKDEVGSEIDFSECEKGTKHAFVVDDSECVAEVTYKWYLEQIITSEKKSTSTSIEEL